jgi:hypothetical protein
MLLSKVSLEKYLEIKRVNVIAISFRNDNTPDPPRRYLRHVATTRQH